jgi:hypothetical protein
MSIPLTFLSYHRTSVDRLLVTIENYSKKIDNLRKLVNRVRNTRYSVLV